MRLFICKWFYIKLAIFLIFIFGRFNRTMAHPSSSYLLGLRGALGGITSLPAIKEYATEHGYKQVATPFCHFDLEGALYMESRLFNYMSSRVELGYSYMHPSFTAEVNQNKTKESIGLHCHGGHLSKLFYVYPNGRFADNGRWNGHIGGTLLYRSESKNMGSDIQAKKNNSFSIVSVGPVLGIGFECISGLQLECRYRWMVKLLESPHTTDFQGISLGIGYLLLK